MIAHQLLRLVQELPFVLRSRTFITSAQLPQKLYSCRFTHCFIHSGQGNPTFGATYPFTTLSTPSRVTILLAQFVTQFGSAYFIVCQEGLVYKCASKFGGSCSYSKPRPNRFS